MERQGINDLAQSQNWNCGFKALWSYIVRLTHRKKNKVRIEAHTLTPALRRLKQEGFYGFKTSLAMQ